MAETFLPTKEPELVVWYNNFQLKFATYALTTGQPEVRRYRLRYFTNDAALGDYSDIITLTTTP